MQISCLFCKKNLLFSILHTHFYKTPTSVCPFYYLFYLNNHFPHFFYYFISNSLSPLTRLSPFPLKLLSLKLLSITITRQSKYRYSPIHKRRSKHRDWPIHKRRSKHRYLPIHKCRSATSTNLQAPILSLYFCWCIHAWVCLILWCL